jgi:hypothetical protein
MPPKVKKLDSEIQPVREPGRSTVSEAFFDRLPDGEFDVVVATLGLAFRIIQQG